MCDVVTDEIPVGYTNGSNVAVGSSCVVFTVVEEDVSIGCERTGFGFLYTSLFALFEYIFEESVVP